MSQSVITISYQLNPPAGTVTGDLSSSKSHQFPLAISSTESQTKFYNSLRQAVADAKDKVGDELTAWRDAVGKGELSKETSKTLKYDADEEDDDEQV